MPVILGLVLLLAYFGEWKNLYWTWVNSPEMNHGLLAIPVAAFMVWRLRDRLAKIPVIPGTWGLALVLGAIAIAAIGAASRWVFASQVSILITLFGGLVYLYGTKVVRGLAYPLCVVALMIPPPSFVYTWVTFRLQLFASWAAERCLDVLGYTVLREGNVLEIVGERLLVAEACSGIRSFLTLFFFFLVYCFFFVRSNRMRALIVAATLPITVIGNILRLVATAIVAHTDRALAHGILHESAGYAILAIGAVLGILLHRALDRQKQEWRLA